MKNARLLTVVSIAVLANCVLVPGVSLAAQYQNSDGSYGSQTDFIRDLNGTPCGIGCDQRRANERQAHMHTASDFYSLFQEQPKR